MNACVYMNRMRWYVQPNTIVLVVFFFISWIQYRIFSLNSVAITPEHGSWPYELDEVCSFLHMNSSNRFFFLSTIFFLFEFFKFLSLSHKKKKKNKRKVQINIGIKSRLVLCVFYRVSFWAMFLELFRVKRLVQWRCDFLWKWTNKIGEIDEVQISKDLFSAKIGTNSMQSWI